MNRIVLMVVCFIMFAALWGCGGNREKITQEPQPVPVVSTTQIRIANVSNETRQLFDVDVIGLLWTQLERSLYQRGALWTGDPSVTPLNIDVHILKYKKGHVILRNLVPLMGETELVVKCELKQGDQVIATIESREKIAMGKGGLSTGAWRDVFSRVAEEITRQIVH